MEEDDAPIFAYLYRSLRPRRHLEFGTWQGFGAALCLEHCDATVWTINLPNGETQPDGGWSYYQDFSPEEVGPGRTNAKTTRRGRVVCQTDTVGFIGREYLARGLGNRVCQVYCDSRLWDTSAYPDGFFDSVLIDGGHSEDVVISDTCKALPLVRSGGLVMWHDYCLDDGVRRGGGSVQGVLAAIDAMLPDLGGEMKDLFWIEPSWILAGVKR
jgi:hypothetical protein